MIKINKKIFIVAGLGFGDEGKGTTVDYLTRKYDIDLIVRYNGGSQAAHNVVEPDGRHHCFSQFGSGMLVPKVKTYLSDYMLINLLSLEVENKILEQKGINDAIERLFVNENCLIVTPFHKIINRMQEISRGDSKHGSCGKGIGQTAFDGELLGNQALRISDLNDEKILSSKLNFLWRLKIDLAEQITDEHPKNLELRRYLKQIKDVDYVNKLVSAYLKRENSFYVVSKDYAKELLNQSKGIVFEGAQGILLDEEHGFFPYVTKSKTTFANALELIGSDDVEKLGVLRAFSTRHGAGPFVTENPELDNIVSRDYNITNEWQGKFRAGWLDLVATKFAIDSSEGIDSIVLTNIDNISKFEKMKACVSYKYTGSEKDLLDLYFDWELTSNQEIKITKIKKGGHKNKELSQLLFDCVPFEFVEFKKIQQFIDFIQSEQGLDTNISILSFGTTWMDKVEDVNELISCNVAKKRIAIFGGSFNPPSEHHQRIAKKLSEYFDLIIIVPCGLRSDKSSVGAVNLKHRKEMVKIAFEGLLKTQLDLYDLENKVYTPTYLLQKRYEKKFPDAQIWHVVGGDIITNGRDNNSEIHKVWQYGKEIWHDLNFTIIVRPGYLVEPEDMPPSSELIEIQNIFGSGSMIRKYIAEGKSIEHLVEPKILNYIEQNGLYLKGEDDG